MGAGFEGIHVFDISNPAQPLLIKQFRFAADNPGLAGCGSHTATAVPDPARDALYIYNGGSSNACNGIDIFKIKLSDPAQISVIGRASNRGIDAKTGVERVGNNSCHDNNVLLNVGGTSTSYAMCAGGNGLAMFKFDLTKPVGEEGSVEKPTQLWTQQMTGVGTGHSGSFTYDGKYLIFGHEPGGGSAARCQATSTIVERTLYLLDPVTGETKGEMLHPRPQGWRENCTWHDFNVVPTKAGYYATSGSYQSGISIIDFSTPAAPKEIAYADPAVLEAHAAQLHHRPRWRLVHVLAQRHHLPVRHQAGVLSWQLNLGGDASAAQANAHLGKINTFAQSNPQTQLASYAPDATMPTITSATEGAGLQGRLHRHDGVRVRRRCRDCVLRRVGPERLTGRQREARYQELHGYGHRHRRQHHDEDHQLQGQQHRRHDADGRPDGLRRHGAGAVVPDNVAVVRSVHARRRPRVPDQRRVPRHLDGRQRFRHGPRSRHDGHRSSRQQRGDADERAAGLRVVQRHRQSAHPGRRRRGRQRGLLLRPRRRSSATRLPSRVA